MYSGSPSSSSSSSSSPSSPSSSSSSSSLPNPFELSWCTSEKGADADADAGDDSDADSCIPTLREGVSPEGSIVFTSPATGQVQMNFPKSDGDDDVESRKPKVLVLLKIDMPEITVYFHDVLPSLLQHFEVSVQPDVHSSLPYLYQGEVKSTWDLPDLVITIGGDGLLLFASSLFPQSCPPILPIAGGSLGFLTSFPKSSIIEASLKATGLTPSPSKVSLRLRLKCTHTRGSKLLSTHTCLNECAISRSGDSLTSLSLCCDSVPLTNVQADGIILATPTGSTAYSMAAGGSVVHPGVAGLCVTPICPHVLSFRSMVFPDHVSLSIHCPEESRSTATITYDGRNRTELGRGETVTVEMSEYPLATVCRVGDTGDWVGGLGECFGFNKRKPQQN